MPKAVKPGAYDEIVQGGFGGGPFRKRRPVALLLQESRHRRDVVGQAFAVRRVRGQRAVLGRTLGGDQPRHVLRPETELTQPHEIGHHLTAAHEVDAGRQHAEGVEQRLERSTVSTPVRRPATSSIGSRCTPRRSTSESAEGKPYRWAPLTVAKTTSPVTSPSHDGSSVT